MPASLFWWRVDLRRWINCASVWPDRRYRLTKGFRDVRCNRATLRHIALWLGRGMVFFVISGFVVTTSLLSRRSDLATPVLRQFYARRAARILPIYLTYVGVGAVVSMASVGTFPWAAFTSLALFYNNFQSAFATGGFPDFPVAHLWTISVEMQFYIGFGVAFAFLSRRGLGVLLIALVVASPALRFIGGIWLHRAGWSPLPAAYVIYTFSPMHFDSFSMGAILAGGRAGLWRLPSASKLFGLGIMCIVVFIGVFAFVNHQHHLGGAGMFKNIISGILIGDTREVWLYSTIALLSTGVIAMTVAGRAPWAFVTKQPLLQAIGRASYGGYVYHPLCVRGARALLRAVLPTLTSSAARLGEGVLLFTLALAATAALALLSYRFIERPIIAAANRQLRRVFRRD